MAWSEPCCVNVNRTWKRRAIHKQWTRTKKRRLTKTETRQEADNCLLLQDPPTPPPPPRPPKFPSNNSSVLVRQTDIGEATKTRETRAATRVALCALLLAMLLPAKALVSREATVTCSPTGQSFYLSSITCATPLTSLCCSKIKKQKPCLCQYGGSNLDNAVVVESEKGVVASDNGCCSEIGASMLRKGGHAVDAAVATALCIGVVNPMASGIGGGAFMIVQPSSTSKTEAYNMRETAPLAASQDMYENNPSAKYYGALSMGVPGEIAGLHQAWLKHGRLAWSTLFQPSIKLAKEGFVVAPYLARRIEVSAKMILNDPGLRQVFAPGGKLLRAGNTCYNVKLGQSLEAIAEQGADAFYDGSVGEKLVKDVREAGGILTMEDLRNYKVEATDAMSVEVMGYTAFGMQPPSSGTLGFKLVMDIINGYGDSNAAEGNLGMHRLIEAIKHMFAVRMNLADPNFVSISEYMSEMLSPSFAKQLRQRILDDTTFPSEYYMYKWSQIKGHGTSHFGIVDAERNAVSMTTTVNYPFGGGVLSPSTGIVLNNEMADFSIPTEVSSDRLPPAPANFIQPNKRPLSSMTPLIITKDNQLAGVIGGSGGMDIIPAVTQVFLNHFVLGMKPSDAVQYPRVYHRLIPNVVHYENYTCINGNHIELADEGKLFLKERGHKLEAKAGGGIVQLVVHSLQSTLDSGHMSCEDFNSGVVHGTLTAVSDPRKDGRPAAV